MGHPGSQSATVASKDYAEESNDTLCYGCVYFPGYKINHSKKYVSDLFRLASSSLLLRAQIKINISSHGVVSTSLSLCI